MVGKPISSLLRADVAVVASPVETEVPEAVCLLVPGRNATAEET